MARFEHPRDRTRGHKPPEACVDSAYGELVKEVGAWLDQSPAGVRRRLDALVSKEYLTGWVCPGCSVVRMSLNRVGPKVVCPACGFSSAEKPESVLIVRDV